MTLSRRLVAIALAVILLNGTTALACGPFTLDAVFVHTVHPTYPLAQFAAGKIGVVQPSFARSYLFVAYRHLRGLGFTAREEKALVELWQNRLDFSTNENPGEWSKVWLEARKKVPGVEDRGEIDVYRSRDKPNEYEFYVNCNKDSFETASKALADRLATYGIESPLLLDWVQAQDAVFGNCGSGTTIPEPLPADARPLARQDREYQIAAAHFYSANFDEAKTRFEAIAADGRSPWHFVASYMVARTLIRKASLGPPEQKQESLGAAEGQLKKILDDKSFAYMHATAQRLANLVRLRLYPEKRVNELGGKLAIRIENFDLKQELWDYTTLLDRYLEVADRKSSDVLGDDLSDWIATFQSPDLASLDHALERLQAKRPGEWQRSDAWLIAALSKIEHSHARANELLTEALNIKPTAGAFASARFHAVRLLMEAGKKDQARTLLDELLKNNRAQFDDSSLNLLMSKRMLLASTLDEFLVYAPRIPAALSWNDDGREVPIDDESVAPEMKELKGAPRFDSDAGMALNQQIPVALLKTAAKNTTLPLPLRRDLAQAAWLRAALLDDTKTADELVPVLSAVVPGLSALLDEYRSATTPQAKKFSAIYAWLKFPGLEPVVDIGVGRQTPLQQQDLYRDNWWCSAAFRPEEGEDESQVDSPASFTARNLQPLNFLSAAEKAAAEREFKTLSELGAAPNYIADQVIQRATKTPNDPRVPEALHLAVTTTRYGCTDEKTGRWSKAAFDLLHRKYPNTTWAKKTPYWFKD